MNYIGSIIGDYCGSTYKWNNVNQNNPHYNIDINNGHFTDNTVCTMAVMHWLCSSENKSNMELIDTLRDFGKKSQNVSFNPKYKRWLYSEGYNQNCSGVDAAVRSIPCAYYANTLDECLDLAEKSAKATHKDDDDILAAKVIGEAIYLARSGAGKEDIVRVLESDFGYSIPTELNVVSGPEYQFNITTNKVIIKAISCFVNSANFSDCIRLTIWSGGETNTITALSCGIAEAYYGIPHCIMEDFKGKFPDSIKTTITNFNEIMLQR